MSSPPDYNLRSIILENLVNTPTPEELAIYLEFYKPYEAELLQRLENYEEDQCSWRDYNYSVMWEGIPDFEVALEKKDAV